MDSTKGAVTMCFFLLVSFSLAQKILQHPVNIIMFQDWTATFTCEVSRGSLTIWTVNGKPMAELSPQLHRDVRISSEIEGINTRYLLRITARAEYNGITVQCLIFNGGFSDNVSLIIQGPVSKVVDIRVRSKSSSVTVSWTPPFSLDVTDVDLDVWYSVLIYNMTDENSTTDNLCTDCMDVNETNYTFTHEYFSHSHVYNICVVPLNGAGEGQSSTITIGGIEFTRESISFIDDSKCSVIFNITGELSMVNNISLDYGDGSEKRNFSSNEGSKVMFTLPANRKFSTFFNVGLEYGSMENVSSDYFTTFDVQDLYAKPMNDGRIQVTGRFINGSKAKGCLLAFESNSSEISFVIVKRNESEQSFLKMISLPPSKYTVYGYDLEENSLPNPHPANLDVESITVNRTDNDTQIDESISTNVSIIQNGSNVIVDCVRNEGNVSFVVVYKAHGNSTLNVIQNKTLPLIIPLNRIEPMNYTFVVFLMINNEDIHETPVVTEMIKVVANEPSKPVTVSSTIIIMPLLKPSLPPMNEEDGSYASFEIVVVGTTVASLSIIVTVTACVLLGIVLNHKRLLKFYGQKEKDKENLDVQEFTVTGSSTYAAVVPSFSGVRSPLPLDSAVQYAEVDVRATHKMAIFPYAELGPPPASRPEIKMIDARTESPYATILPQATNSVKKHTETETIHKTVEAPPTVETVMSLLMGVASRWKVISEGFGFDEDLIDEIDTNNETDEACLQDCVEKWVGRLQPTWKKLSIVLSNMGEDELAQDALNKEPSESGSEVVATTQDSGCGDSEVMVVGAQLESYPSDVSNEEDKEEARRPCSTHAEENPVLTSEKQMQEETADSETISCPVEQTSLKFEDNQCCESGLAGIVREDATFLTGSQEGGGSCVCHVSKAKEASKSDDGKHKVEANPNQGEEMGYIFTTESQEGGDSEGEVVTGAHEDNNSLTSDTNLESLSTDDKRGKNNNIMLDDNCSRGPAVTVWPTLQEENHISCYVDSSSEYLHHDCVEEEKQEELEKVFVTTSKIWSIPMPHYSPRFVFLSNFEHNTEEHPSLFKNDDEADDVGDLNINTFEEEEAEDFNLKFIPVEDCCTDAKVEERCILSECIIAKTCNTDKKSNGVRSGVAKQMSSASIQYEYESTKFTDNLVKAFHRSFSQGSLFTAFDKAIDIFKLKANCDIIFSTMHHVAESQDQQLAQLELIANFYNIILYNGDRSVVASMLTRTCRWLGYPDNYHEMIVKWMYAGEALGFHGPDKVIAIKAHPPWSEAVFCCLF